MGLDEKADQKIVTLSGGRRRRLDVAIGIIGRPELLFLDEPTAGFDPHARREFHDLVHRLSDFEETTILLTTHDLDEAERLADRILILAGGRIVADGSADELARRVAGKAQGGVGARPLTGLAPGLAVAVVVGHDFAEVADLDRSELAGEPPHPVRDAGLAKAGGEGVDECAVELQVPGARLHRLTGRRGGRGLRRRQLGDRPSGGHVDQRSRR